MYVRKENHKKYFKGEKVLRNYLIITEKPYVQRELSMAFERIQKEVNFTAKFASANCHVVDSTNTKCHYSAGNNHNIDIVNGDTWVDDNGVEGRAEPFTLKTKVVDSKFRVLHGDTYTANMSTEIKNLVKNNQFDLIINACDPDEEGDLKFQYTLESLGLENMHTHRMRIVGWTQDNLESELLKLNNI